MAGVPPNSPPNSMGQEPIVSSVTGADYIQSWVPGLFPQAANLISVDNLFAGRTSSGQVINGATINNSTIGLTTPAAGSFASFSSAAVDITGGTIDGTLIGNSTPADGYFAALHSVSGKFGSGTTTGLPYNFQSAIDFDPSSGGAVNRQNIFNTKLSYASTTTNIWEGVMSAVEVRGPGTANGEINGFHSYHHFNSGANAAAVEQFEASFLNDGTLGENVGYLASFINGAAGVANTVTGMKTRLVNNNSTPGQIAAYIGWQNDAISGTAPTTNMLIKNGDPDAYIGTLGGLALGQIANPGAGTLFKLKGTDNSAGTFPIIVTNLAGTQGFVMDNSMKSYFGGLKTTIDATGAVVINGANTSGGTFPFTVYNSSSALLLGVGNDGTTHFAGNSSNVDGGGSFNGVQFACVSGGPTTTTGNGAPSATQPNGSIYLRKDGAANTRLYVSEGGGAWSAILSS